MTFGAFIDTYRGFTFPCPIWQIRGEATSTMSFLTLGTIDATGERFVWIGPVVFSDRGAGGAATINTSSSIDVRLGTTTWAQAASSLQVGIQDVDATNTTYPTRPDGTFDVSGTINPTGGANPLALTTAAWNTIPMDTGSKSISHGDVIAVSFDFVNRVSADSIIITGALNTGPQAFGGARTFLSSTWAAANGYGPFMVINPGGSDTRRICFNQTLPIGGTVGAVQTYNDTSNPDEYGNIFQVPFRISTRTFAFIGYFDSLSSDIEVTIYRDPLGTPTAVATTTTIDSSRDAGYNVGQRMGFGNLSADVTLEPGVNYCIAIKALGASSSHDFTLQYHDVNDANHFKLWPCGTTAYGVSRNGGSGAFAATASGLRMYDLSIVTSEFETGQAGPSYNLGI